MKKRDIITIVFLVIVFSVLLLIAFFFSKDSDDNDEYSEFKTLTRVRDENIFISVEKNINIIYEYAITDSYALNYLIKNNVDVTDYKQKSYKAVEMYVISNLNLYKYYVKGNLYKESIDSTAKYLKDEYYILNYDMNNRTFNIEVIDEDIYNNALNEKKVFEVIDKNNYNKFSYTTLNNKSRAIMYFTDYIDKLYLEPEEAYNLLSTENRYGKFYDYEFFTDFIKKYNNISLKEYSVSDDKIGIKDNYGNEYIFEITDILKYVVSINETGE